MRYFTNIGISDIFILSLIPIIDMRQILTTSTQLGQIIAGRRKINKLSQNALATKLAISQNRFSELETDPGKLTVERLLALANVLGLELIIQDKKAADIPPKTEW